MLYAYMILYIHNSCVHTHTPHTHTHTHTHTRTHAHTHTHNIMISSMVIFKNLFYQCVLVCTDGVMYENCFKIYRSTLRQHCKCY